MYGEALHRKTWPEKLHTYKITNNQQCLILSILREITTKDKFRIDIREHKFLIFSPQKKFDNMVKFCRIPLFV